MNASNQVLTTKRGEVRKMHVNRTYGQVRDGNGFSRELGFSLKTHLIQLCKY